MEEKGTIDASSKQRVGEEIHRVSSLYAKETWRKKIRCRRKEINDSEETEYCPFLIF